MARGQSVMDLAMVQFSCHEALLDSVIYPLLHAADVGDPVAIKTTALSMPELPREIEGQAQYGQALVPLNACSSSRVMVHGEAMAADATHPGTAQVGPNITVFASSSATELSRAKLPWGFGTFTSIVLEALSSRAYPLTAIAQDVVSVAKHVLLSSRPAWILATIQRITGAVGRIKSPRFGIVWLKRKKVHAKIGNMNCPPGTVLSASELTPARAKAS
jgi:hypothetical protein